MHSLAAAVLLALDMRLLGGLVASCHAVLNGFHVIKGLSEAVGLPSVQSWPELEVPAHVVPSDG